MDPAVRGTGGRADPSPRGGLYCLGHPSSHGYTMVFKYNAYKIMFLFLLIEVSRKSAKVLILT